MRYCIADYRTVGSKALLLMVGIAAVVIPIFSQGGGTPAPKFEVASIKPAGPVLTRIVIMVQPGGRFIAEGFSLKMLVGSAYALAASRIIGGPSWVDSDRFNIEARAEGGNIGPGQMPVMLQELLADRFQLKVHRETRELPVYELVVARGGPKIKLSEDQTPLGPPQPGAGPRGEQGPGPGPGATGGPRGQRGDLFSGPQPRGSFARGNGQMRGTAIGLAALVTTLSQQLGRPVIDKTGLTGLFDLTLQWTPGAEQVPGPFGPEATPPPADPSGPSIFTALQEQLGLRLESTKGPVEVVIIDSAEKPSEN